MSISYEQLAGYVDGHAGIRARTELKPLGGDHTKVFPPTYGVETGSTSRYALEERTIANPDGTTSQQVEAVVLNSVAAQAHRFGAVLQEAFDDGDLDLPVIGTDFTAYDDLAEFGQITDLTAPHRTYDAILRDSLDGDLPFRAAPVGRQITDGSPRNAAALYTHSPCSLIFGAWDSTGPRGGRGTKFERALTSEIVASEICVGVGTSSRIDPLGIEIRGTTIYKSIDGDWTLDLAKAASEKGKPVTLKPSEINHGNIRPSIDPMAGGITAGRIEATTVLSLIQLRRLKFVTGPDGTTFTAEQRRAAGRAARTTLAALALCAVSLAFEAGFDLRSRCVLAPTDELAFEAVGRAGAVESFTLSGSEALQLVAESALHAAEAGLAWRAGLHRLVPTERLAALVRRSRDLSFASTSDAEEG